MGISPDGAWLASAGSAHVVHLHALPSLNSIETGSGHQFNIWAVSFSPSSALLVSGSLDHSVIVWRIPTLEHVHILTGHTGCMYAAVFISDTRVVSGGDDAVLNVWDVDTGAKVLSSHVHTSSIKTICVSPNGAHIATGCSDGSFRILDAESLTLLHTLSLDDEVSSVAYLDDDNIIACNTSPGMVAVTSSGERYKDIQQRVSARYVAIIQPSSRKPCSMRI